MARLVRARDKSSHSTEAVFIFKETQKPIKNIVEKIIKKIVKKIKSLRDLQKKNIKNTVKKSLKT